MKSVLLLATLVLCGCQVGTGKSTAKLTEIQRTGLMFESCEAKFLADANSSRALECSSRDMKVCDFFESEVGKMVDVEYKTWLWTPLDLESACEITHLKGTK